MFKGSGRSARGHVPETDPRFLAGPTGRMAPTATNWGKRVELRGANPQGQEKIAYAEGDALEPWIFSAKVEYGAGTVSGSPVKIAGLFGTGGATCPVEFDGKPDQVIQLPGGTVDLIASFDTLLVGTLVSSGGLAELVQPGVGPNFPPTSVIINGVLCRGEVARGSATRTREFNGSAGAGQWNFAIPPFAQGLWLFLGQDANYANVTSIEFMTALDPLSGVVLVSYTGAQALALKNAGMPMPVPGGAAAIRYVLGAAQTQSFFQFDLSL